MWHTYVVIVYMEYIYTCLLSHRHRPKENEKNDCTIKTENSHQIMGGQYKTGSA